MDTFKRNYLIFSTFLAMLIMAITDSTKGILVPTFKDVFGVSDTSIGTFLLIGSLTYVITTYLGGLICPRIGQKRLIISGMLIAGCGFFGTSFSQSFGQIMAGYIIITVGIASMVLGMNTIVPLLKVSYIGILMNCLHFFYGVGSTLTQKVTAYLLYSGISWRFVFKSYFFLYLLGVILYVFVKSPQESHEEKAAQKQPIKHKSLLIACCLVLGFYVSGEMQTANWMLNYLKEVKGLTTNVGATYIALFFGIFSIGRLVGGFVVEKIGYLKSIIISLSIALILYLGGLFIEGAGLYLISLSGLFFAITFPTFLVVVQKTFVNNATYATGIVSMSASAISMIVGYLIGVVNDVLGPDISIFLIPLSLILSILLMVGIKKRLQQMEIENSKSVHNVSLQL